MKWGFGEIVGLGVGGGVGVGNTQTDIAAKGYVLSWEEEPRRYPMVTLHVAHWDACHPLSSQSSHFSSALFSSFTLFFVLLLD